MSKQNQRAYPKDLLARMDESSGFIMKAQALEAMGMADLATSAWLAAAAVEESVAPRLESLDRLLEAAVHRLSAASCYHHGGELAKAILLYQAALAGPLLKQTRRETNQLLSECLAQFAHSTSRRQP